MPSLSLMLTSTGRMLQQLVDNGLVPKTACTGKRSHSIRTFQFDLDLQATQRVGGKLQLPFFSLVVAE